MFQKILVPLNKSTRETEDVMALAKTLLAPGGEGILLHIIPPGVPITMGLSIMPGSQVEQYERAWTMRYLGYFADQLCQAGGRWRCEVAVSVSVAHGIVTFAVRERVDLIAMYTHDRKGPARVTRENIIETVRHKSPIEVRVAKPLDLVAK